jgi:hypothetical protein
MPDDKLNAVHIIQQPEGTKTMKKIIRSTQFWAVAALAVAVFAGAGYAAIPDSGGDIHACYDKVSGQMRIFDSETNTPKKCGAKEAELSWNQQGIQGAPGPQGEQGEQGEPGPPGPAPASLWAVYQGNGFDRLLRASHATGVSRGGDLRVTVTFDQDVSKCAYLATPLAPGASNSLAPTAGPDPNDPHKVIVATQFPDSTIVDSGFSLAVFC